MDIKESQLLVLTRLRILRDRTIGTITYLGKRICVTLEDRVRPDGQFVVAETAIEEGFYEVRVSLSPRMQRELPYLVGVPHHSDGMIRLHRGEIPEHSRGCVLTGLEENDNQLDYCKDAELIVLALVKKLLKKGKVYIQVTS